MLTHGRLSNAYLVVFVSSACTLALQIVAGRLLAPYVGVSLYTWTTVIGVVLAGITAGNYLGGVLADRRPARTTLGWLLLAGGAASLLVLALVPVLATARFGGAPLLVRIVLQATILFLPPSLLLGMVSPVVVRLSLDDLQRAGQTVGKIYACSALGSIVGTFATGYWLIAAVGTRVTVLLVGLTLVGLAIGCGGLWRPAWRPAAIGVAVGAFVLVGSAEGLFLGPCNIGESGYYCLRFDNRLQDGRWVRSLTLDYLIHSYSDVNDPTYLAYDYEPAYAAVTEQLAARQPTLRTLFLGGGGYTFPRYVDAVYPEATIEVAEIDPAVTDAAYRYMGLAPDARVVTYNRDARLVVDELLAAGRRYDAIYGDAFNDLSIPYHLTTREFAAKLRELLAPGGVYLANVIDHPARGEFLRAYVQTLATAFPHLAILTDARAWDAGVNQAGRTTFVVVASLTPLDLAALDGWGERVRVIPQERVDAWLGAGRPLVLTDDYAPVDNLTAPLFADRARTN